MVAMVLLVKRITAVLFYNIYIYYPGEWSGYNCVSWWQRSTVSRYAIDIFESRNHVNKISSGGENAIGGSGNLFLIEADEYDGAFLGLSPQIAVITNVEFDHPDLFKCLRDVRVAFKKFTRRIETGYGLFCFAFDRDNSQNNTCE
jgi:hypothetical protein